MTRETTSKTVDAAARPFESRWTMRALRRVDPELHEALNDQANLYAAATVTGTDQEIDVQGAALARGYAVAVKALMEACEPDDAYILGFDSKTGVRVAIGENKHAIERVRELHGREVIWLNPDEVASMFAGMKILQAVKAAWPDAEIMEAEDEAAE